MLCGKWETARCVGDRGSTSRNRDESARTKRNEAPRVDLILTTLLSAKDLIESALEAVEKLDPDYLCTMSSECPNR